jgi:hypothetical protein
MNKTGFLSSLSDALDRIILSSKSNKQFGLLIEYPTGRLVESKQCDNLMISDEQIAKKSYAFGLPKNSVLQPKISKA